MSKINDFTDLEAWQFGHDFVKCIYLATKSFPREEAYGLTSQLRRAAISITSNIAEGFSRFSYKDRIRFYYNARGSISESQNQLIVAKDVGYLDSEQIAVLLTKAGRVKQILNGLIRSTESRLP